MTDVFLMLLGDIVQSLIHTCVNCQDVIALLKDILTAFLIFSLQERSENKGTKIEIA